MLIDWFTVGAQAINFLILVGLMQHFLYKPILNAIDTREKHIAKKLADAKAQKTEAQKEHEEFAHKNEIFDQERAALLTKATQEAKTERERLFEEAHKVVEEWSMHRQLALQNEANHLHQAITLRILDEVFAIAHKMLTDLAGVSLDERMCEVFTHHLQELSGKAKVDLVTALATSADPVLVRSAFALSSAQQSTVHQALQKISSTPMQLQFEMAPDLIGGIEVIANGNKVAWSIADHLTSLEKDINELLEKNEKSEMKVESKAKSKVKPEAKSKAKTPPNPKGKNT